MKSAQKISILEALEKSDGPISTGRLYQALLDSGAEFERPAMFEFLQRAEEKRIVEHNWDMEDGTIVFTWKLVTPFTGNLNEL